MWAPKGSGKHDGSGLTVGMANSMAAQSLWNGDGGMDGWGGDGFMDGGMKGMSKGPKGWGKGDSFGWGPWKGGVGGWTPGWASKPYEKSEKQKEAERKKQEEEEAYKKWDKKHAGHMPPVDWLIMPTTCKDVAAGFSAIIPAMEFTKDKEIYADAHRILQDFFVKGDDFTMLQNLCDFDYDYDCKEYPEVHKAWKEAGNPENGCTIAKCQQTGQWAAGFGGKDKSTRAAKLALSVALALALDPAEFTRVGTDYPAFAELCYGAQKTHPLVLAQNAAAASAMASAASAVAAAAPAAGHD